MSYCKRHPINNSQAEEADEEVAGLVSKLMGDNEVGKAQGPNPDQEQLGFLFRFH
jgi:hypothetical protein